MSAVMYTEPQFTNDAMPTTNFTVAHQAAVEAVQRKQQKTVTTSPPPPSPSVNETLELCMCQYVQMGKMENRMEARTVKSGWAI